MHQGISFIHHRLIVDSDNESIIGGVQWKFLFTQWIRNRSNDRILFDKTAIFFGGSKKPGAFGPDPFGITQQNGVVGGHLGFYVRQSGADAGCLVAQLEAQQSVA